MIQALLLLVALLTIVPASVNSSDTGKEGNVDCLQFDPTMYASTIDEALFNFPNLVAKEKKPMFHKATIVRGSRESGKSQQRTFGLSSPIAEDDCSDVSCRSCKLHVINGFLSGPIDAATNASLWTAKTSLEASLNGTTPNCPTSKDNSPMGTVNGRDKRAANNTLIGNTQVISCDYKRGDPLSTETTFCGLCSLCWGWRQLPVDYYPSFLNEVQCSTDTTCLKGYGRCNPVTKSVKVLRKKFDANGSFKYEQTAVDTVTSCECQVEYGSALFNMVYADAAS